jgi:phage terminase large subunit-like protein
MSPAMKELEALALEGKLVHDGDPVLTWMVSNIVCHRDEKDNLYPKKESNEKKIDGVLALLMALDRALRGAAAAPDFEKRGLWMV